MYNYSVEKGAKRRRRRRKKKRRSTELRKDRVVGVGCWRFCAQRGVEKAE